MGLQCADIFFWSATYSCRSLGVFLFLLTVAVADTRKIYDLFSHVSKTILPISLWNTHLLFSYLARQQQAEVLLKSNQAWVMRRVIGPLPPEQGQSLEDMIDHDSSTMAARCQRNGEGAHGPPVVKLSQSSSSAV